MTTDSQHDTVEYPSRPAGPVPHAAPPAVQVDVAALSHPGLVRPNNEDAYLVVRGGRFLETLQTNLPAGHVPDHSATDGYGLLVADGVGGKSSGEVASRLAVSTLVHLILDTPDWILLTGDDEAERVMDRTRRRYDLVDAVLRAEAGANPALAGMATTMTVARSLGRELVLGHVGDSRAYLLRGDEFRQLTRDHTLAQELVDRGGMSAAEALTHAFRHVLTRALGGTMGRAGVDVARLELNDGDQLLLCSDGLTDMIDTATIAATLRASPAARDACAALVELALKNGGKDNVTVVVARYRIAPAS